MNRKFLIHYLQTNELYYMPLRSPAMLFRIGGTCGSLIKSVSFVDFDFIPSITENSSLRFRKINPPI